MLRETKTQCVCVAFQTVLSEEENFSLNKSPSSIETGTWKNKNKNKKTAQGRGYLFLK